MFSKNVTVNNEDGTKRIMEASTCETVREQIEGLFKRISVCEDYADCALIAIRGIVPEEARDKVIVTQEISDFNLLDIANMSLVGLAIRMEEIVNLLNLTES